MQNGIKLISLNIERDQHYDTVLPFLKAEQADVVALEEVLERDVERFKKELGMADALFVPLGIPDKGRNVEPLVATREQEGILLLSRLPMEERGHIFYCSCGDPEAVSLWSVHGHLVVLWIQVEREGKMYTIATTHLTWTPNGESNDIQRRDVQQMLKVLEPFHEIVLCGDFNAPRGRETWERVALRYTDNIPQNYTTSIDPKLHVVHGLQYVVDGMFSTPEYKVFDVRLVEGVSDHKAVVGYLSKLQV